MGGNAWTKAENDALEELWPRASWDEIRAALPGRTAKTITKRASDLKFRRSPTANSTMRRVIHPIFLKLRRARDAREMTRKQLAAIIGYHHVQIARWELGDDSPTLFGLVAWAQALDLELMLVQISASAVLPRLRKPPGTIKPSLAKLMAGR